MDPPKYTLPGVMQFLRAEWQQREQARIEWELQRAELQSRVARLEADNADLQKKVQDQARHLEILRQRPTQAPDATSATAETLPKPDDATVESDLARVSGELLHTVADSKAYLRQCIADIRHVLRQSGSLGGDDALPRTGEQRSVALANFRAPALAVALLPENRVVAGTAAGELLLWQVEVGGDGVGDVVGAPKVLAALGEPVTGVRYAPTQDQVLVACGGRLLVYTPEGEFVTGCSVAEELSAAAGALGGSSNNAGAISLSCTSGSASALGSALGGLGGLGSAPDGAASIVHIAIAPQGNLVAVVLADGRTSVWALRSSLVLMSEPAFGVTACAFAVLSGEIHLVLARGPDLHAENEGNLLLADPVSGEALKKIVFLFTAGISALAATSEVIVLGTDNGDLRVIALNRGDTLAELTSAHRSEITSITAQGERIVTTSMDGRVSLWALPTLAWRGRLFSHDGAYGALASASGFGRVAVSGGDGILRVYEDEL